MKHCALLLSLALLALAATGNAARGDDDAKAAREQVREVKKAWKDASKADKYRLLRRLVRWRESSVSKFLGDVIADEPDDEVASWAAHTLVKHENPDDQKDLVKLYNRAKTPGRRASCIRWLGLYGKDAPLKLIEQVSLGEDESAEAAVLAGADANTEAALELLASAAAGAKLPAARTAACIKLLQRGDARGVECLKSMATIEEAARAAHAAVGGPLETAALREVLTKKSSGRVAERPHFLGSLLARITAPESHEVVRRAASDLRKDHDAEVDWWMISVNRAYVPFPTASKWLEDEDPQRVLSALRTYQRVPNPYESAELAAASGKFAAKLGSDNDEVVTHALFACAATGAAADEARKKIAAWIADEKAARRAAALLAAGPMGLAEHAETAIKLLKDETWWVVSAALDYLLHVRPKECLLPVLELATALDDGRVFAEAIALLCDLTGENQGDLLAKWAEIIAKDPPIQQRKLSSLRGVPYKRMRQKTSATFYGLELDSTNLQFALDRSVSMAMAVTREPERRDYPDRKAEILRRRPEVSRLVRDGFLPRYYVAAAELNAALDAMSQKARYGITLFNTELMHSERVVNAIDQRRKAVNWMLMVDPQGGTDIKAALLDIIEKADADTIVLLSDGEPTSLQILEEIHRANAVKRVNINVVSIHQHEYYRHYMQAMAEREYGRLIDAEPKD